MKNLKTNESGITLIEILVAISLLSIVLVTFMGFFTNAFQYNSMSSEKVKAVNVIREKESDLKDKDSIIGNAFYGFMKSVSEKSVILSGSNYPGLNLSKDIQLISESSKPDLADGDGIIDEYYLLDIYNTGTSNKFSIYVKKTPDIKEVYRIFIETYDTDDKLLSKTFTYYEYK